MLDAHASSLHEMAPAALGASTRSPEISVLLVSFNTRALLRECISSIEREAADLAHETIVVDNASRDGSADMIATEFPDVRLIRSRVNLGFAAASNRAFRQARGRYIVLLNPDAFLRPLALQRAVAHMDATPRAAVGGGRLLGPDESWRASARMFPSPLNDLLMLSGLAARFPRSRFLGRADRTWADPAQPTPADWVPGVFNIIRREALEHVGFFDDRFFLYYEEVDLCRRFKAAGYEVWYWPDIVIVHVGGASAKTISELELSAGASQLTLWRMRSALLFYRKHHGVAGAWAAMLLELWWNRVQLQRHRMSRSPEAERKALQASSLIRQMTQAWRETRGGKYSPPKPW
jgi:GT2 family glycosyltransferase